MKKTLFTCLSVLALNSWAQQVQIINDNIGGDSHEAYSIEIKNENLDDVEDAWKKFLKSYDAKVSKNKKTKETFGDNALVKSISINTIDVYAKFIPNEVEKTTTLITSVDLGGIFMSSNQTAQQYKEYEKLLIEFSNKLTKMSIEDEIKEASKALEKLEDGLKDKEKEKSRSEKDIADCKKSIEENENKLKDNAKEQEQLREKVGTQKGIVDALKEKAKSVK